MKEKVAIIGTGIAGMGIAHFLQHKFQVELFEKNSYIGGHTNTIEVPEGNQRVAFDTGFMVFNFNTYPELCKLFDLIQAPIKKTDMSFSVLHVPSGLEYCGSGIDGLFAQRKNIFNVGYIKMLMEIARFNKESVQDLDNPLYDSYSVREYMLAKKFSERMFHQYLIPMSSAVWSTPMEEMEVFPIKTLIRFFYNHGFLGLNTQHQWYTLEGGSESYKVKLIAPFKDRIYLNKQLVKIERKEKIIQLYFADGSMHECDRVVFASHADETFEVLRSSDITALEQQLLSKFKYAANQAIIHTDEGIMPKNKKVWSSWNYRIETPDPALNYQRTSTIYWMNRLQGVSKNKNYFVSINDHQQIDSSKIISKILYHHPMFDGPAIQAQQELYKLNEQGNNTYFCGSYFKYGFHEDAFASSVQLAKTILEQDPWSN